MRVPRCCVGVADRNTEPAKNTGDAAAPCAEGLFIDSTVFGGSYSSRSFGEMFSVGLRWSQLPLQQAGPLTSL